MRAWGQACIVIQSYLSVDCDCSPEYTLDGILHILFTLAMQSFTVVQQHASPAFATIRTFQTPRFRELGFRFFDMVPAEFTGKPQHYVVHAWQVKRTRHVCLAYRQQMFTVCMAAGCCVDLKLLQLEGMAVPALHNASPCTITCGESLLPCYVQSPFQSTIDQLIDQLMTGKSESARR